MTLTEVKALVIRTTDLSESDRLIRLYSDRFGIVRRTRTTAVR